MDPVTAFGIACGVIQILQVGFQAISAWRETVNDGATRQNLHIEDTTTHLAQAYTSLDVSLKKAGATNQLSPDDQQLQNLAVECLKTSKELSAELEELKPKRSHTKHQALEKTFRGVWKKPTVEKIQERLENYQKTLDTRILVRLYQQFNITALQQSAAFKDLDSTYQTITSRVATESTTVRDQIANQHIITRNLIKQEFYERSEQRKKEEQCTQFHQSLYFPELTSRQEQITDAHKETFQWIFDTTGKAIRPWDNFVKWLEEGSGVFWIVGKAGSGKSTLMNYICADSRTDEALRVWAHSDNLAVPMFYFWNAGSLMQKNSLGLLRSLLYQILDHYPQLTPILIQSQSESHFSDINLSRSTPLPAWTEKRLLSALKAVVQQALIPVKICFFIDGLDEFEGCQNDLLDLVHTLKNNPNVKICLSSRPLRPFELAFEASMKLKLQDLTYQDIKTYVTDKLLRVSQMRQKQTQEPSWASALVEAIVSKADGVFLWVNLAVKDMVKGLQNEDSRDQLEERLRQLPAEIEGFYIRMLNSIDKIYGNEASEYFQVILEDEMSLLGMSLARNQVIGDYVLGSSSGLDIQILSSNCESTRNRLNICCGGILEVNDTRDSSEKEPEPNTLDDNAVLESKIKLYEHSKVQFLHRTARDFLVVTSHGKNLLKVASDLELNPYVWQFWGALTSSALRPDLVLREMDSDGMMAAIIDECGDALKEAELRAGKALPELIEFWDLTIDRVLSSMHLLLPPLAEKSHWTTRLKVNYRVVWGNATDLVGVSVSQGLYHYPLHVLDHTEQFETKRYASYLLHCALPISRNVLPYGGLKVIGELLERGADPDVAIDSDGIDSTPFARYMKGSWELFQDTMLEHDRLKKWATVTAAFLVRVVNIPPHVSNFDSEPILDDPSEYSIVYKMSVASIIDNIFRLCRKNNSLKEILAGRSAQKYQRITSFQSFNRKNSSGFEVREVPELDSEYLMEAYLKYINDGCDQTKRDLISMLVQVWEKLSPEKSGGELSKDDERRGEEEREEGEEDSAHGDHQEQDPEDDLEDESPDEEEYPRHAKRQKMS